MDSVETLVDDILMVLNVVRDCKVLNVVDLASVGLAVHSLDEFKEISRKLYSSVFNEDPVVYSKTRYSKQK